MTMTMENRTIVRTHKGIGIASFVIGVTCVTLVMALIGTIGVMTRVGKLSPEATLIIGLGMLTACFVELIGIALGLFGTVDRSSKKVYPVLGLILNTAILALFAAMVVVGLAMTPH
jgi:hypothetical protein